MVAEHCSTAEGEVGHHIDWVGVDGNHHLLHHLDDDQRRGKSSKTFFNIVRMAIRVVTSYDDG